MESAGEKPRRRIVWKPPPVTLADRVVTAAGCAGATAASMAVIAALILLQGGDAVGIEGWKMFWRLCMVFTTIAAVAGFVAGPERAVQFWGVLWGTEEGLSSHRKIFIVVVLIIATAMGFFVVSDD